MENASSFDMSKHLEFFDPINQIEGNIHIIGCGAGGSTIAEMLTRMGVPKLHLWDFDTVTPHNLANQTFRSEDIGKPKTQCLHDICNKINPNINITCHEEGWKSGDKLSGYIFLCVDNIDLRREIVTENQYNQTIKAMFDFRMRLTDGQHYAANWQNNESVTRFLNTMQFTHAEAKEATPINACGTTMNIIPTVRILSSLGLSNFINFLKKKELKQMIIFDAFEYLLDAF